MADRADDKRPSRWATPGPGSRRRVILTVIVAVLIVGGLIDRAGASQPAPPRLAPPVPVVAAASSLSSSWFCGGASAPAAAGTLIIANPTTTEQHATVRVVASKGPSPAPSTIAIPAGSRRTVPEAVATSAAWVAATVTLDGGGGAVEQELSGPLGSEVSPCATAGSTSWYFPSGTTLRNADEVVSLYNPYPANAIVDLSFVTDQGPEDPENFQAILVPGGSLVPVDLGTHLRRRSTIATTVSVRTGQVVAWKTEVITPPAAGTPIFGQGSTNALADPVPAVGGVSSTLGAASLDKTWYWPDGVAGGGVVEQYVVYNPGSQTADLRLTLTLDEGGTESFPLTVGAQSVSVVSTLGQIRVPAGIAHNATLASSNGVAVVAERTVTATVPSKRQGTGELIGAQVTARRWVLAAGSPGAARDEWIELQNPSSVSVRAMVASGVGGTTPVVGLSGLTVKPGGRLALHLTGAAAAVAAAGPLTIVASGGVVVERDLYGATTPGIAFALGAPDLSS